MTPLYIKIENFFSHKQSEIDFSQFNSALLIGNVDGNYDVSNGSGKSAIFEGLLWCLFNKTRAAAMNDIIMWGENECMVSLIFSHEENTYRIRRLRSRVSNTSTVFFDIQDENGEWMDISGSTSKLTNEEIVKRIRFDYKTFINSAYFRQNDISEFAESDAGRRKEILKSIIDISKWDEYEKEAKGRLREAKAEGKLLEALCKNYDDLNEELGNNKEALAEVQKSANENTKERQTIEKTIEQLEKEYNEMKKNLDTAQWDRVVFENEKLKKDLVALSNKKKNAAASFNKAQKEISNIKKEIEQVKKKADSIILIDNADKLLEEVRNEITEHKGSLASSIELLEDLEHTHIHEGECYVCGHNLTDELYKEIKKKHDDSIVSYRRKKIFAENKIRELADKTKSLERSIRDKRKKDSYLNSIKTSEIKINYASEKLKEVKAEIEEIKLEYSKVEHKIEVNENILESLRDDNFNELRKKISSYKERKTFLDNILQRTNRDVGIFSEKVSTGEAKIKEMEESRKKFLVKRDRIDVLTKLVKLFGKNGIQTILLNAVIHDLEESCNKILATICNDSFEVIIETQRVGSDGVSMVDTLDLRVKKDGVVQHFKSLSGGEKFRVSLALRIALSEISSRHGGSSLEFLLLDEINSPLDRHGIETLFINVIKALEDRYKIMVITHDDTLKERFNNIIDVTKSGGESSINFITR